MGRARDPIERYAARLTERGVDIAGLAEDVAAEVAEAVAVALTAPMPDPATATDGVFCDERAGGRAARPRCRPLVWLHRRPTSQRGGRVMAVRTYLQAISDGLREEMRSDERVFVMGEDVGAFGGAFKVTDGLLDEFGAERVRDTPIAEAGIVGTAVGAALAGLRPVCEMQFGDFVACGFDQLVNVAGKMHYRLGLAVPLTVRLPVGGGFSGGPFHSQNPEAWFMHAPGLKVVAPSTPADAKGLLAAAIRDPNPVIFLEHKHLYRRVKGEVPEAALPTPMTARVARSGEDLSDLRLRRDGAHGAAGRRGAGRVDVEVVDLRSLVPLDEEAILASVRKTSKALVLDEANATCAAGAQVAALIAEQAFEDLDGPVRRVATPDVPIPFSPPLEQAVLPGVARVKEAVRELLDY